MSRSNKLLILLTIIMIFAFTTAVFAAPTVTLDGQQMSFEVSPVTDNGRTLVPLRAIFEAMGATVTWDPGAQTATAIKGDTTVILPLASTSPTINGQVKTLDVPAKAINGSILAPLRFVSEAFGGTVAWNQDIQLITILSAPGSRSATELPAINQISEQDKSTPTVTVPTNQVPTQVEPESTSTKTKTDFPTNKYGQTYGSSANCSIEQEPDLVKAIGIDGTAGYVLSKDLNEEMPKTPEEAIAMTKAFPAEGKIIPLYAVDGRTVIGKFKITSGDIQKIQSTR